jgi:hypothetical protein
MATLPDEDIETEARAMMRDTIERSGWYPNLRGEEHQKHIEQDVDQNWPLMVPEAQKRLEQRNRP